MTAPVEHALQFPCAGEHLLGIVHAAAGRAGVVVIVGGPQYRVGSHRQFVLLARHLAGNGVPVLRFDYRGMGDSSGASRNFEQVHEDIAAAIDALQAAQPQVRKVVLWGLCDGASAALFYAHHDARVAGLVVLNPWVREAQGEAKAYIKHYYLQRLLSRDFWRKLLGGGVRIFSSLKSFGTTLKQSRQSVPRGSLPERVRDAWAAFRGPILLIQSGDDLTAREFDEAVKADPAFTAAVDKPDVTRVDLAGANHTFAKQVWRDAVATHTLSFVLSLDRSERGPCT